MRSGRCEGREDGEVQAGGQGSSEELLFKLRPKRWHAAGLGKARATSLLPLEGIEREKAHGWKSFGVPMEPSGHPYGWNRVSEGRRPEKRPEASGSRDVARGKWAFRC